MNKANVFLFKKISAAQLDKEFKIISSEYIRPFDFYKYVT